MDADLETQATRRALSCNKLWQIKIVLATSPSSLERLQGTNRRPSARKSATKCPQTKGNCKKWLNIPPLWGGRWRWVFGTTLFRLFRGVGTWCFVSPGQGAKKSSTGVYPTWPSENLPDFPTLMQALPGRARSARTNLQFLLSSAILHVRLFEGLGLAEQKENRYRGRSG